MRKILLWACCLFGLVSGVAMATPALDVLGKDYVFPNRIDGLPAKLSDFKDLQINSFITSDGVKIAYWEAGKGKPLIFIPGWSADGTEYINVMYLLEKHYRVIVMDPRNQGLSQNVDYGYRIARFSMDLKELQDHLGISSADYCGWSMGASVLWSYIDLFGTKGIHKAVFVDEPITIVGHADWSADERRDAGAIATSPDDLTTALQAPLPTKLDPSSTNFLVRSQLQDSPYYVNSESFAHTFVHSDMRYMALVVYNHGVSDWRDVLKNRVNVPVAFFTGEYSANVPSQHWAQSVVKKSKLYVYTKAEQGDHFLMFKNPFKFTSDLQVFLNQ